MYLSVLLLVVFRGYYKKCCHECSCTSTCAHSSIGYISYIGMDLLWICRHCDNKWEKIHFFKAGKPFWVLRLWYPTAPPHCLKLEPVPCRHTTLSLFLGMVWWEEQGRSLAGKDQGSPSPDTNYGATSMSLHISTFKCSLPDLANCSMALQTRALWTGYLVFKFWLPNLLAVSLGKWFNIFVSSTEK